MRINGKPKYLNLYYKHFAPLLRGIDLSRWDIEVYLLSTEEMPSGMQGTRIKFTPPKSVYIPMVDLPDLEDDTYMRALVPSIAHEFGHYGHETFMGEDGSDKWHKFAEVTGITLDFNWTTINYGKGRQPYSYIPAYEDFADNFSDWLRGKRLEMEAFYMGLWGQEVRATKEQVEIIRTIWNDTSDKGKMALKKHLEKYNPRMLVYL